nr:hypothetical protein [uncultured Flavobacterium sp.]
MASCKEEGCLVLTTGKCVNGLEIDICPHYSSEGLDQDDQDNSIDDIEEESEIENIQTDENGNGLNSEDLIDVHSGKALTIDDADKLAKLLLTRLVVLAGMPEAGKTTLLLSLIHMFSTKLSYEGFIFAGSETLLDFEEKSHLSKIDSEIDIPFTGRTPFGAPTFMHLRVANQKFDSSKVDLLFTDISGETFKALKDSTEECKKFELCQRADHFVLFFDTKKLTSIRERASSKSAGIGILRSLIEAETLLQHTNIQIVFSRWDLFDLGPKREKHEEFLNLLKEEIKNKYAMNFNITFHEIACRPKDNTFTFGHGLGSIFSEWVNKSQLDTNNIQEFGIKEDNNLRQFMKFKFNN